MAGFTIYTADSEVAVPGFTVQEDQQARAVRAETKRETGARVFYGDRGLTPSGLTVRVTAHGATLNETRTEVGEILAAAREATLVETPRGGRLVNGLMSHQARFDGRAVVLTLTFAPESGRILPARFGLRGEWRFDAGEGDLVLDRSGHLRHHDITGATWTSSGLSFDGVDDGTLGGAGIVPTGDATMILALRYRAGDSDNPGYMGMRFVEGPGMSFRRLDDSSQMSFRTYDNVTDSTTNLQGTGSPLLDGEVAVYCATFRRSDGRGQIARNGGDFTTGIGQIPGGASPTPLSARFGTTEYGTHPGRGELFYSLVYSHIVSVEEWRELYQMIERRLAARGVAIS